MKQISNCAYLSPLSAPILAEIEAAAETRMKQIACPIGRIIVTEDDINPGVYIPDTLWEPYAPGRVLVGVDPNDATINAAGMTRGAKDRTITAAQMPVHAHASAAHSHAIANHTHILPNHSHIMGNHTHYSDHTHSLSTNAATFDRLYVAVNGDGSRILMMTNQTFGISGGYYGGGYGWDTLNTPNIQIADSNYGSSYPMMTCAGGSHAHSGGTVGQSRGGYTEYMEATHGGQIGTAGCGNIQTWGTNEGAIQNGVTTPGNTGNAGSGSPIDITPPETAVYMWKRVA